MDIDELKGNTADLAGALNDLSDQVGEPPRPLLILQGNALIPFQYCKRMPSFPSNSTREYPHSLLKVTENILIPF